MKRRVVNLVVGALLLGLPCAAGTAGDPARAANAPSHLPSAVDVTVPRPSPAASRRSHIAHRSDGSIIQAAYIDEPGPIATSPATTNSEPIPPPLTSAAPRGTASTISGATPATNPPVLLKRPGWPEAGHEPDSMAGDFVRMATWTLVVLGVGVGAILLLKRVGLGGRFAAGPAADMRLCGTLMLAPRMGVHLVSVSSREFLVAVDQRGISAIAAVPPRFDAEDDIESESQESQKWPSRAVTAPLTTRNV